MGEGGVFAEFAADHEFFDVVDWVDIFLFSNQILRGVGQGVGCTGGPYHAVFHHSTSFFQAFVWTHCADGVSLDEYVAAR